MTDEKRTTITIETTSASENKAEELVNRPRNSDSPTSPTGSTRTYTSPLMGTSARAAKRRMDSDSGPIRIEGTDIYNQQLQHHYQNVRQILDDQQQPQTLDADTSSESRQSFSAKRDYFEQRFKTPPPTYDAPPRQQSYKIITNIVTKDNIQDRTSSSSNESPSVDRVLEQAVELQKLSNTNSSKTETQLPFVIERTEQYQVFLDSANHEVRRTPSISRTSIIPITKTGHATDLDQAQAQIERTTDDHQAIQNLTRVLQEHNVTTINEYKRLPSQTNPTTPPPSSASAVLHDRTNLPLKSEYSVIDALLNNPLGTIDDKYNQLLTLRSNDIVTNLRNPEYLNTLKQPSKPSKTTNKKQSTKPTKTITKKQPKEKKSKQKTSKSTETIEHSAITPLVNTSESVPVQTTEPIVSTTTSTEQTPLINPKEKKKQEKENKKQNKTKPKSKSKSKNGEYQVIDAIIGSPVSLRLPGSYLTKYNVSPPISQSSPLSSVSPSIPSDTVVTTPSTSASKDKNIPAADKNQTLFHLTKIVNDLKTHHVTALAASLDTTTTTSKEVVVPIKPSEPYVTQGVHQQRPEIPTRQTEARPLSEPIKPRVIYRYMDEQGRILKISSTPPSQLREQPAQQYAYRNTEPPYFYGRHIVTDDDRRHPLPQYEQRATWQGEPKLPTTVTREDFESRDKRVPHIIEQSIPTSRTVPVSVDHEHSSRPSSQQQHQAPPSRTYHYPNQQNVKLAWLPLSYPTDQQYIPVGTTGYDTDSTLSERSTNFRPYDYGSNDPHYRYSNRLLYNDYYNRSPGPAYYPPPPPPVSHGGRGISPDYGVGGVSRNYIEVFRGGDFRQTKPSEIYSLPLSEHMRTSPIVPTNTRHSRYDQYQSERFGSTANRENIPVSSSQYNPYYSNTLPHSRYPQNIPSSTAHTSSYYTHRNPYSHRTVQSSPHPEYTNYIRQSKSFDYRPLRTKLQREYKITPNLLVDEWDYPHTPDPLKYSTTTASTTNRSGLSSPDDVFITTRTNKEFRWHVEPPSGFNKNRSIPAFNSDNELSHTSSDHDRFESNAYPSPISQVHALHHFYGQSNRELSFKKGDRILIKRRINDDWLEGEHQGKTGIFPASYVELLPSEIMEGEAMVKYDFLPQNTSELQLRKGEKVVLLRKLDNDWYEGRLNQMEGIFPADYVEILREPKEHSLTQSNQNEIPTKTPKSVLKNSTGFQQTATEKMNIIPQSSLPVQRCQVLYDYTPQNPDELEIHVGDIIKIIEMCDDGWYCGVMEKSNYENNMDFGTFPGNYVKILPI